MTRYPLPDGTALDVPSLGFGPRWRAARRLLTKLARVRAGEPDLEAENRLWRALFAECQGRAGTTRRECRRLLDGPVGYPQRHDYEQLLLFGEATRDAHGLKKNSGTMPAPGPSASSWLSKGSACVSWIAGFFARASLPRPTSISSASATASEWPQRSAFWIRRSR